MLYNIYLFLLIVNPNSLFFIGLIYVVWVAVFLLQGRSWHQPIALVPSGIGAYLYLEKTEWSWLLLLPAISLLLLDLHLILSKPKFRGWVSHLSYLLTLPFLTLFLFHVGELTRGEGMFSSIYSFIVYAVVVFFVSKFWISDVLILVINRLYAVERNAFETAVTYRYLEKTGRSISYYCVIDYIGTIETSGFFYSYVGFRKIMPRDKLLLIKKKGCLGIEYISGFPKIISRGS